ncbi:MAG: hypothetical protein PF444_10155 [Bacteroidales bacterium]|jgi:hypothetical protein|nr:hypothetical protein [Bacteroidales bacterium]
MTIKTFWTLIIKILGIWLILSSLTVLSQFMLVFRFIGSSSNNSIPSLVLPLIFAFIILILYLLIIRLFIFKPSWIINKLHLEEGFEEEKIDLNINYSTVLTTATIIIGGLIFVESFPQLCRQIIASLQDKEIFRESQNAEWIIFQSIKTTIAYLLMTNSRYVVRFINKNNSIDK